MIITANESVEKALREVLPDNDILDIFVFGHSVGGLFALSWHFFVGTKQISEIVIYL